MTLTSKEGVTEDTSGTSSTKLHVDCSGALIVDSSREDGALVVDSSREEAIERLS